EGGLDAVLALLDRAVRKPDRGQLRQPLGDVHFDVDQDGVDAKQRTGKNLGEHETPGSAVQVGMKAGPRSGSRGFSWPPAQSPWYPVPAFSFSASPGSGP